jgi:hypothetical protein
MTGEPSNAPYYGRARTAAGLLLIALVMVLAIVDAVSVDYHLDGIVLGVILGTALLFLGVEAGARLLRGGQ